ncbi:MAG: DUF4861 family protein [Verrucomicrobiota bacterium]
MKPTTTLLLLSALLSPASTAAPLKITAENKLSISRSSQTLELTAAQLSSLGSDDLTIIHVQDASGKELVVQAVDTDGDAYRKPDILIFQADFAANESHSFTASLGKKRYYTKDQYKAYGRFIRERFDDFAWENDRVAHRTYGKALETWEGEPLSSSTIDVWSKGTSRLVINDWYLTDDYHSDHGEGADFYSAGASRGGGGNGVWAADKLWTSRNFSHSNVLSNGPIRVLFELTYQPFEVNGISVSEMKRVSLDAGSQFNRFQSTYKPFTRPGQKQKLTSAIGLRKTPDAKKEVNAADGTLTVWEKVASNGGNQGLAIVVAPELWVKDAENDLNHLVLTGAGDADSITYHAGSCWDKAGHIPSAEAWQKHVREFVQSLASPIEITVTSATN